MNPHRAESSGVFGVFSFISLIALFRCIIICIIKTNTCFMCGLQLQDGGTGSGENGLEKAAIGDLGAP